MKHVPKYLLPRIAPVAGNDDPHATPTEGGSGEKATGFVPFRKDVRGRGRGRGGRGGRGAGGGRGGKKKADPLKKFGR